VETKAVVDLLQAMDCDYAQGYYYAKPIGGDDILGWYPEHII
jgi:EAL domain-containing protein (putative c-di-GMP-specific phosphodiesterase class I)